MKTTRTKFFVLALTLLSLGVDLAPSNAHAIMAVALADPVFAGFGTSLILGNAALCKSFKFWAFASCDGVGEPGDLAFMGYLLLDRKLTALPPVTKNDLMDNGYTEEEADRIFDDVAKLDEKLSSERKAIAIKSGESLDSIRSGLKGILPDASDEFLDLFSNRLELIAQSN